MDILISTIQTAAALFLAYGAFLCVFGAERRTDRRTDSAFRRRRTDKATAKIINLPEMATDRRTDFAIGFHQPQKRAA